MNDFNQLVTALKRTPYHRWMEREGLPIVVGHGVEDVRDLPLNPWHRTGGNGSFIHLYWDGRLIGDVRRRDSPGRCASGKAYVLEEVIVILEGNGATEVWQEGEKKHTFEWNRWSLFAPPLNSRHRLVNGGCEPVKFLAVTTAPIVMDLYRNEEFIFNSPFIF